jgi:hypothetical protein
MAAAKKERKEAYYKRALAGTQQNISCLYYLDVYGMNLQKQLIEGHLFTPKKWRKFLKRIFKISEILVRFRRSPRRGRWTTISLLTRRMLQ